jgi:integrase
MEYMNDASR